MEIVLAFIAGVAASYIFWPVVLVLFLFVFYALDFDYDKNPNHTGPSHGWAILWSIFIVGFIALRGGVDALKAITLVDVGLVIGGYMLLGLLTVTGKFALSSFKFRDALRKEKFRFIALLKDVKRSTFVEMFINDPHNQDERDHLGELHDKYSGKVNEEAKLPTELTNLFSLYLKGKNQNGGAWSESGNFARRSEFKWTALRATNRVFTQGDTVTSVVALNPRELPLYTWGFWWPVYIIEFVYRPVIELFKTAINQLVKMFAAISLRYSSANI